MEMEGPSANPRRAAMENYGARPDVHDLLSRFMTDLLCTQPDSRSLSLQLSPTLTSPLLPSHAHPCTCDLHLGLLITDSSEKVSISCNVEEIVGMDIVVRIHNEVKT